MALYVDCAYLEDVAQVCAAFPVDGVTTNPSILLAAAARGQRLDAVAVLRELLGLCRGPVFVQPTAATSGELVSAGLRYVAVEPARVVLKLPMSAGGVRAGLTLRQEGARLSFTAVYSLAQAYTAAMVGAEWVIPYFGRLRRAGCDAPERVQAMVRLLAQQSPTVRVLAASLKSPGDVVEATVAGAHDVTVPPEVIHALTEDGLSQDAIRQFDADWQRFQDALG